ncbi:hypothetical protein LDENG_00120220 [Lucifuga dentata]|nr:hypothetical protein LDENG_00120220 [Lucifuga dentata]
MKTFSMHMETARLNCIQYNEALHPKYLLGVQIPKEISIECVDDVHGFPGVIVYEDTTISISVQQSVGAASCHGQVLRSSVRPFQFQCCGNEDTTMEIDPPASNVTLSDSTDGVVPMEVD